MKIKSLHQDNHTKLLWHSKTFERTLEKTILYYHLNTYTEYFINGILQHCKHIVRLNVWFRSLSGFHCVFGCDVSQSCFAQFGRTRTFEFLTEWTYCAFTTVSGFLYSCINMCKQAESSSFFQLISLNIELLKLIIYGAYGESHSRNSIILFFSIKTKGCR